MGTKTRTKLYSTLLSVMMLVNLVPTPALAEGDPQPTETPVIVQTETPAAEPENNTAVEPTPTPVTEPTVTEEVPVIPVEENTEPASTETPAPEQTPVSEQEETPVPEQEEKQDEESKETEVDSEEDTEESEETELEETEDEEVSYPAVTLSETVDGVTVTLTAPEGSLPEGVHMTVEPVHEKAIFEAVDGTLAEEGRELASAVAFDITLYDAKENELQPNKYVTVSFSNTNLSSNDDNSTIDVYRVSDDASEVTPVTTIVATDNNQMFITDHFTIYLASSNLKTDIKGSTGDPNGDGTYQSNGQGHRYYLEFGEQITLESNESSIFTDEWYIHGATFSGAITQIGDRTFQNTNTLASYEIATIAHKYGFLGRNIEYFFVSLKPRETFNVTFNFKDIGETTFKPEDGYPKIEERYRIITPPSHDGSIYKDGKLYIFSGWCSDEDCTKVIPSSTFYGLKQDIKAYAMYNQAPNAYAIVYNGNADDCTFVPAPQYSTSKVFDNITREYPERPGYAFTDWADTPNGEPTYSYYKHQQITVPEGKNVFELYATWEETTIDIFYGYDNYEQQRYWGDIEPRGEYNINAVNGKVYGSTATPKPGYRFVRWRDKDGNTLTTEQTFVPEKIDGKYYKAAEYFAVFEPITYTVTFKTNGGNEIPSQTVNHGAKVTQPADPTKGLDTCFTFEGWYSDSTLETQFNFNTAITSDITLYAKWGSGNHQPGHAEAAVPATCETAGHKFGYMCEKCGKYFTDIKCTTEITDWVIPALGHDWETTYSWGDNNTSITATRVCRRDSTHSGDTATGIISTYHRAATCVEKERMIYVATFANENFQTQVKEIDISPALGHEWGTPTYTWDEDNSRVIAVVKCARNSGHVEAESVNTAITTRSATCTSAGSTTYSATFKNPLFTSQTKTVDTPALGHDWDDPTYTWANDNSTVTAKHICKRDGSHVEDESVNTNSQEEEATCTTPSATVYTATFNNSDFKVQTKRIEGSVQPTGHSWGDPTYIWTSDNSAVTAKRICANDNNHVNSITVKTTKVIIDGEAPTCTETGRATFTADFSSYGDPYATQTKTGVVPALGHEWGEPTYSWIKNAGENGYTVTATRQCERVASHTETENGIITSVTVPETCTKKGYTTYIATFPDDIHFTTKTDYSATEPSHSWSTDISYVWSEDYSTAVGYRHCTKNPNHVDATSVKTTMVITKQPTCTETGLANYYANFNKEEYENKEALNIDIPALGHDWGEWEVVKDPTAVEEGLKQRVCAHDNSHVETEALPKVTYSVKTGDGQTWTKGSDVTADFEFERSEENEAKKLTAYDLFTEVQIDGTKISAFKKEKGSVITKIYASYLETLSAGDHKITAKFSDGGSVTASFTVKDKEPAPAPTPDEKKSSGGSSTPAAPVDNVVTCQMAGYPANYSWNEAAKACQPGYIDAAGNFHPYSTRERAVPNTYDQGLAVHTWILGISALTAVFCALTLRRDSLY